MNKLINILREEIENLTKKIELSSEIPTKIDQVSRRLNPKQIGKLTPDLIDFIENFDSIELTEEEYEFLESLKSKSTLEICVEFGLAPEQKLCLREIVKKVIKVGDGYTLQECEKAKKRIENCKDLLTKLNNAETNIITELDFIVELLDKYEIDYNSQIAILIDIDKSNCAFFDSLFEPDEEEVIYEDDLEVTNINSEDLKLIFEKYSIDFDSIPKKFKDRLLKYGDTDKIDRMLKKLVDNNLNKVFSKYEMLTRVLLYSTEDIIDSIIKLVKDNDIDNILNKYLTILFPTVRNTTSTGGGSRGPSKPSETGASNHFKSNIELFKSLGIPIKNLSRDCPSIFIMPTKTIKKSIDNLKLYGIDVVSNIDKIAVQVLSATQQLDNLDIAIECGAYDYCSENLSRLKGYGLNLYRLKYNNKLKENGDPLAEPSPIYRQPNSNRLVMKLPFSETSNATNPYGKFPKDTFKLYGAVVPLVFNSGQYNQIIAIQSANKITSLSKNSSIVKQLDELYKSSELVYSINGVIISRYKVIRYLELFMSEPNIDIDDNLLLYIVTKDTMLDEKELNKIMSGLSQINVARRRVI